MSGRSSRSSCRRSRPSSRRYRRLVRVYRGSLSVDDHPHRLSRMPRASSSTAVLVSSRPFPWMRRLVLIPRSLSPRLSSLASPIRFLLWPTPCPPTWSSASPTSTRSAYLSTAPCARPTSSTSSRLRLLAATYPIVTLRRAPTRTVCYCHEHDDSGSVSAEVSGAGGITVGRYGSDPVGAPSFNASAPTSTFR